MRRSTSIEEFTLRAKKKLPREKNGKELNRQWEERIKAYRTAGLEQKQSIIYASLEFLCLTRILKEYDFDQIIDNRPIGCLPDPKKKTGPKPRTPQPAGDNVLLDSVGQPLAVVHCEDIEKSHRENLRWAMGKAGEFERTGAQPDSCPNNSAWWLYQQAKSEPRDFLAKCNQIEGKSDDEAESARKARYTSEQSIGEIDEMLDALEEVSEENAI